ncbi:MAG: alpha/beta hydrolase [Deltaproteobacteria bacterium]|jgi:pimeloyl-ACP methyl ester carboxylesterase|nr:alpha/beta hydrolase [Deltaproteobacteria bacterium]
MLVDIDGVSLFYKQSGSGDPLLLLHGNSEDSGIFDVISEKLRGHFSVLALDSRNHGKSQRTEDISYGAMAGDVVGFIRKLDLGQVFVVGFSDGAIIALMVAMGHPGLIRRMVLLGPNMSPDDLTDEAREFIQGLAEEHDSRLFRMILSEPNLLPADLARIDTPSLLVFGQNDLFKPGTAAAMAQALPNSTLKIMPGHDHLSYVVGQDIMFPDIMSFFGRKG